MSTVNTEIINSEIIIRSTSGSSPEKSENNFPIQTSNAMIIIALLCGAPVVCPLQSYFRVQCINPKDYHTWELLLLFVSNTRCRLLSFQRSDDLCPTCHLPTPLQFLFMQLSRVLQITSSSRNCFYLFTEHRASVWGSNSEGHC